MSQFTLQIQKTKSEANDVYLPCYTLVQRKQEMGMYNVLLIDIFIIVHGVRYLGNYLFEFLDASIFYILYKRVCLTFKSKTK